MKALLALAQCIQELRVGLEEVNCLCEGFYKANGVGQTQVN